MFDGILFRGFEQETVETLAEHAGIPVWNGLTNEAHPTQALADLQTIRENTRALAGTKVVYMGNGRNNVANSIMLGCAKTGIEYICCSPGEMSPASELVSAAAAVASENGGTVEVVEDPSAAVVGAHVIYTDVWLSMGEEGSLDDRIATFTPYQVTMDLMKKTGNLDSNNVIFLHCLPAFHDNQTALSAERGALEVTDEVFSAPFSKVFDLCENKLHTLKAVMVATLT
jgi:ornithine carbamoyltransferase